MDAESKDSKVPDSGTGQTNAAGNDHLGVADYSKPTDDQPPKDQPGQSGHASVADQAQAMAALKKAAIQNAAGDLPAMAVHQDNLALSYDKGGKISQIVDGDGTWQTRDGVHFTQTGNKNTRTLSKDEGGHLIFVDQNVIDKEAQRIGQDLQELHQHVAGRDQAQCERDIRNALAAKTPAELKALDCTYQQQHQTTLYQALLRDTKLSSATRDALGLYWKGAGQRSDDDVLKLADTALKYRSLNLFEEAMRDATPEARRKFIAAGGEHDVYNAFTERETDAKTGALIGTTELDSLARARDYMYFGKLSVATQVKDNKGQEAAVETAIGAMTDAERKNYLLGKSLAGGQQADPGLSAGDQNNAQDYYKTTRAAFEKAGNKTDVALWEAMIASPDNGTLAKLASHRGWLYNDSPGTIAGDIEQINNHDLAQLRDKNTGPTYKTQIDTVLRSFLRDTEAKRMVDLVDRKSQTGPDNNDAIRLPVLESMMDSVHYFSSNDQGLMVKSLLQMTPAEQSAYRSDSVFRQGLDQAVNKHMSGPGKDAAHYILSNTLADKAGKNNSESCREDIVVKLYEHALNDPGPDRKDAVRDLQSALNNDAGLRNRINSPQTDQERAFSIQFHKAADVAIGYQYRAGRATVNSGASAYLDSMLSTGHITTSLAQHMSTDSTNIVDPVKFIADMQNVSPGEKEKLQNDKAYRDVSLIGVSSEKQEVLLNTFKQGKINPEDQLRAAVIGGNNAKIVETLKTIKPADLPLIENQYATKYGAGLEEQTARILSGPEKAQAGRMFEAAREGVPEQEIASQTRASHARSGVGNLFTEALGYGSGAQLDDTINKSVHAQVAAAQAGRHLTDSELQKKIGDNYTNINNFLTDKQTAADTVTNITTVAGAAGIGVATGGATLPMLASGVAFGAGCRIASQKLVMGENYDATIEHLSKDAMLGGLQGGAISIAPELLMAAGTGAADLASTEVLQGAAGKALTSQGQQASKSGMRTMVQSALKSGADNVADADIEALAAKAGNRSLAGDMKAALPKAYKQELEKTAADGLRTLKANSAAGALGGGISGAGSEALNGESDQSAGQSAGTRTVKILKAGLAGAGEGAAAGLIVGGIAEGISSGASAKAPAHLIERSPEGGQILATTDASGAKAQYTWGERDGQQVLTKIKHNGVEEELTGKDEWRPTELRVIDGYEEKAEASPGTRALDHEGNLIVTVEKDPITSQTKFNLDGSTERTLRSGGTIVADKAGLPAQVACEGGNKMSYTWDKSAAQPQLKEVTITAKDGSGTTTLTRADNGWRASSRGSSVLPANARVAGVSVEGGGTELKVTLDNAGKGAAKGTAADSISYFSDGAVVRTAGWQPPVNAAQGATSKLLREGKIEISPPKTEGGLLKVVRFGTITGEDGNKLSIFVRPLNDPNDATALYRIRQTQIARDLHALDGIPDASPNIALRDVMLDGKLTTVAVQPDQGENFLSQLRRWTAESKGLQVEGVSTGDMMKEVTSKEMADYIKNTPEVYKAVGTGFARRIADGGMDFQGSNWTIAESIGGKPVSPDQPMHLTDIDSKRSYSTDHTTTYGRNMDWGDQAAIARDFEGKRLSDISPDLQKEMENRLKIEENDQGRQAMDQAGLTPAQIAARIARTRTLVENGFPPTVGKPMELMPELIELPAGYDDRLSGLEDELLAQGKTIRLDDALKHNQSLAQQK